IYSYHGAGISSDRGKGFYGYPVVIETDVSAGVRIERQYSRYHPEVTGSLTLVAEYKYTFGVSQSDLELVSKKEYRPGRIMFDHPGGTKTVVETTEQIASF